VICAAIGTERARAEAIMARIETMVALVDVIDCVFDVLNMEKVLKILDDDDSERLDVTAVLIVDMNR
jgi:uncharacterized membrane protein